MFEEQELFHVWNRELKLEIRFDCFPGEKVLETQTEALDLFIKMLPLEEIVDKVEKYCLENNPDEIEGGSIEDIFQYVMPKIIYVLREESKRVVALLCDYKLDIEHGIAIVFENESLQAIGPQDIIL